MKNAEEINTSIGNFIIEGLLTKKIGSSLIKDDARTPRFYLSPKIHKKNNPGRPVVSSIDSSSSNISM